MKNIVAVAATIMNNQPKIDYEAFKLETLKAFPNLKLDQYDEEMIAYANEHKVPIIQLEGLAFLKQIVRLHKPQTILEIGSAIGFSASQMAKCSNAQIITIERDELMYQEALKNIEKQNLQNRINIHFKDALEAFDLVKDMRFDMLFIDAAKGQYRRFFEMYEPLLNEGGIIVTDNLTFHGLIFEEIKDRNLRQLVRKIKEYNAFLLENENYETSIFQIGDGISISIKKEGTK